MALRGATTFFAIIATSCHSPNPGFDPPSEVSSGATTSGGDPAVTSATTVASTRGDADATSDDGPPITSATSTGPGTSTGGAQDEDSGSTGRPVEPGKPGTYEYPAEIAECVLLPAPDPLVCERYAGLDRMAVDSNSDSSEEVAVFLAFPIDNNPSLLEVTEVTLRLTASDVPGSTSDASGSVSSVEPFAYRELFGASPTPLMELAGDQGQVSLSETVSWSLPPSIVEANSTVYLGVFPLSVDGVYYWNNDGVTPPVLEVVVR